MKEKIKLVGVASGDKRTHFLIKRHKMIYKFLADFFEKCGIPEYTKYIEFQHQNKDIMTAMDHIDHFKNDKYDFDLAYGNQVVYLIARYKEEKDRDFITSLVLEYCEFKSYDVTAESKKKTGQQSKNQSQ